jgi:hypothetical protein
MVKDNETVIE